MTDLPLELPLLIESEDKSSAFINRLRKNYRHLRKWGKRTQTDCFRIYDKEIHGYPLAIDFYSGRFCVHYFSKNRSDEDVPQKVQEEVNEALMSLFDTSAEKIYWRTRFKRTKYEQYEKKDGAKEYFQGHEYGLKFWINLVDYLDTGLFLDHRETRRLVGLEAKGKRVLNLFAYTCAFSLHAALGGAHFTKSVDMSNTYTTWGKDNFLLNGFSLENHVVVREDCMKFLDDEIKKKEKYDIIIIDPPTISRSKKMDGMFDIQLDYKALLLKAFRLLDKDGVIFFSTNSRKFRFEESIFDTFSVIEITHKTVPQDFHDKKIHRCWKISNKAIN